MSEPSQVDLTTNQRSGATAVGDNMGQHWWLVAQSE